MDRRTFNFGLCGLAAMTFAAPIKSKNAAVSIENAVSEEELNAVYEEVKTPYKYGIVLDQLDGNLVDGPNIFRKDGTWYMVFISIVKCGYETFLAKSGDLLHWEVLGKIGSFPQTGWDAWQFDCGTALVDYTWGGSYEFQKSMTDTGSRTSAAAVRVTSRTRSQSGRQGATIPLRRRS